MIRRVSTLLLAGAVCWTLAACNPATAGGNPTFQARGLVSEEAVSLLDLRGHPSLLTTWAVWCTECREELSALEEFWQQHASELQVVAVNVDAVRGSAMRMAQQFELTMPVWQGTESSFESTFGTYGVPSSVLLNSDGEIVARFFGPIDFDGDEFQTAVRELLAGS